MRQTPSYRPTVLVVATILLLTCINTLYADSRIAFSSEQTSGTADRDIWKSNDSGSSQVQVTSETADVYNPTIAHGGRLVIYDDGAILYAHNFNGTGSATILGGGTDPIAGPYINSDRDFQVIYTVGVGGTQHVQISTLDVSEMTFVNTIDLTPNASVDQLHPTICGTDHFAWSADDSYATELCWQEFDGNGAVSDTKECYFRGVDDGRHDRHPACDSTGTWVAWARENSDLDNYSGRHEIWTMDLSASDPESTATRRFATNDDAIMPEWSPGDAQIAFAWNRLLNGSADYELWKINSSDAPAQTPITGNLVEDDAPSWGPAVLP